MARSRGLTETTYTLGDWMFFPRSHELVRGGARVRLEHRTASMLEFLCERRGQVVARDALIAHVWGERHVSGNSLPGYTIPLVNVPSPDNMTSLNGTVFSPNVDSGQPQVGTAGTAGFGSIESSSLESSTVDLATELTAMIQAQSAYEANSKVFQAGANLLSILNKLQA